MKPAKGQCLAPVAVGKQSEVADFNEGRQGMEQEAADELDRIELHDPAAVVVPQGKEHRGTYSGITTVWGVWRAETAETVCSVVMSKGSIYW